METSKQADGDQPRLVTLLSQATLSVGLWMDQPYTQAEKCRHLAHIWEQNVQVLEICNSEHMGVSFQLKSGDKQGPSHKVAEDQSILRGSCGTPCHWRLKQVSNQDQFWTPAKCTPVISPTPLPATTEAQLARANTHGL